MPKFNVATQFIFTGKFTVIADSEEEARKAVKEDCGLVMGGNVHSNLNDEDVNWDFDTHPETKILDVTQIGNRGMSKKEFKERCFFNTYKATGVRINAIWFDWKSGCGYKFAIWTDVKNAKKDELFNDFYAWVNGQLAEPYYYEGYKYAETDERRFKVPLSLK